MKKLVAGSTFAALSLTAVMAFAGTNAGTGISGSGHDMNIIVPGSDPYGRVCAYCHTPHHAIPQGTDGADYLPLWSHQLTQETYTPYASPSMAVTITDPLTGPTRLCMSCHDGAIAVDQHYGMANTGATPRRANDAFAADGSTKQGGIQVGKSGDLTGDHPVGFLYADVVAAMPNDIFDVDTPFIENTAGKKIGDGLTNGYFTCATCHDVHNKDNVADAGNTYNFFLYAPQAGSKICLSCHNK